MFVRNPQEIKERIMNSLTTKGPNIPSHIAREVGLEMWVTSAFLSELVADKKIKVSFMRVGSSPVYFVEEQRSNLENFGEFLKSKAKEAFLLLKEKKFLKDDEQEPAIRVALREIKDFAIPFKDNEEIIWRYFIIPESEFNSQKQVEKPKQELEQETKEEVKEIKEEKLEEIKIIPEKKEIKLKKPREKKPIIKRKTAKKEAKKTDNKFFSKIKENLSNQNIEILDIDEFDKNYLSLIIKENESRKLLICYNKKRLSEKDLIKAYKKSKELNLPYTILSVGDVPKKMADLINASKDLDKIKKLE